MRQRIHGLRSVLGKTLVERGLARSEVKARAAIDAVFSEVARLAIGGYAVEIRGFGVFSRLDRAAQTRKNPKTGAKVSVPPAWRVGFRAGKHLRGRDPARSTATTDGLEGERNQVLVPGTAEEGGRNEV